MNTEVTPSKPRLHPLVAVAAVSVIALCGVGIATFLNGRTDAKQDSALTAPATGTGAPMAAMPVPAPVAAIPAPVPKHHHEIARAPENYGQPAGAPVYNTPPPQKVASICHDCGVVDSLREVKVEGQGSGLGGVAGGVVGGLLGNRVGHGNGKTAATVLGAIGGALAGNEIEKKTKAAVVYEMTVRFEDGTTQVFKQNSPFGFGQGDRVRLSDGHIIARNPG